LNPLSGATVWSDSAGSGAPMTPGVAPALVVADGRVISLRNAGNGLADVVATDASTGRTVWHSEAGEFSSWPAPCPGEAGEVCVTGTISRDQGLLRFDAQNGKLLGSIKVAVSSAGRDLTSGLFDSGTRNPEMLVATTASGLAWRRPLARLFPLPHVSTDWGWNFDRLEKHGLFVGAVSSAPIVNTQTRMTVDVAKSMTVGFRIKDGTVVWRSQGTQYVCGILPCAGAYRAGFSTLAGTPDGPTVGVRLRATGTLSGSPSRPTSVTISRNATVTVEGFNPRTGVPLWTFDAGRARALLFPINPPPQVGASTILLHQGGRTIALDLATGSRRSPRGTVLAWCRKTIIYHGPAYRSGATTANLYVGQGALFPCTDTFRRRPTPTVVPAFVKAIGATAAGITAWSEPKGVTARTSRR
jgi:outer membrane protein assembly factor BamB